MAICENGTWPTSQLIPILYAAAEKEAPLKLHIIIAIQPNHSL